MTYSVYNINSPPPYLLLSKNERVPTVLTIGNSNSSSNDSVETDIKILTSHRCHAESLIHKFIYNQETQLIIPQHFLCGKFDNLSLKVDLIKFSSVSEDIVNLLNKNIKNIKVPIVVSDDEIDNKTYKLLKLNVFHKTKLFVCNYVRSLQLLNISKQLNTTTNINNLFKIISQLSEDTSVLNILLTNCTIENNDLVNVLYCCYNHDFIIFSSKHHHDTQHEINSNSMIATSIAANLANGFPLKEAVYGSLEYIQNTHFFKINNDDKNSGKKTNDNNNYLPNTMYSVDIPLKDMIQDRTFNAKDIIIHANPLNYGPLIDNFHDYLIQHPLVKPYWESFVNHNFVKQIADGTLPLRKFQYFIEQDYSYLVDYGRVHYIAASKAPNLEDIESELFIVKRIRDGIIQHEKRLREYFNISDSTYFKRIKRGTALNNYTRYFNDVANRGNWQELVVALTPCLMGYGVAVMKHHNNARLPKGSLYYQWIATFTSEEFRNDMESGLKVLNYIARTTPASELEKLIKIYGNVCNLETKFWDAALHFE